MEGEEKEKGERGGNKRLKEIQQTESYKYKNIKRKRHVINSIN